jgi:tRNA modification GTPase
MVIQKEEGLEIAAEELKMAREYLDVVVGKKTSDQLLGDIFSNFCIGK